MTSIATPRVKSAWAWAALGVLTALLAPSAPAWLAGPSGAVVGGLGLALVLVGVLWRLWATLYIGGRKGVRLITGGPYAMSRHPLYFGSAAILAGLALRSGRPALLVLAGVYMLVVLAAAMRREDEALAAAFPEEHAVWSAGLPAVLPLRRPGAEPPGPVSRFALRREALAGLVVLVVLLALDFGVGRAAQWPT